MTLPKFMLAALACSSLGLAAPALAQDAGPAPDAKLPACTKTVTDHCMQRGGHDAQAGTMHHGTAAHHKGKTHHKGKAHHKSHGRAHPKKM